MGQLTDPFVLHAQMKDNFGLINRSYPTDEAFDPDGKFTQWQRFAYFVSHLNENTSPRTEYKVLFLGRHGEAWHNVAEAYYGHDDWEVSLLRKIYPTSPIEHLLPSSVELNLTHD